VLYFLENAHFYIYIAVAMAKEEQLTEPQSTEDIQDLIPQMNVTLPETQQEQPKELIGDEHLLGVYGEIMTNLREDRSQVDEVLSNFLEMVMNEGDTSTSSKEALVNLIKLKTDTADKMAKIADLMTRIKLKEANTYKPYLNAKQDNKTTINIGSEGKRALLQSIAKMTEEQRGKNGK